MKSKLRTSLLWWSISLIYHSWATLTIILSLKISWPPSDWTHCKICYFRNIYGFDIISVWPIWKCLIIHHMVRPRNTHGQNTWNCSLSNVNIYAWPFINTAYSTFYSQTVLLSVLSGETYIEYAYDPENTLYLYIFRENTRFKLNYA